MKILHHVQVEEGDSLASIAAGISKYTGVQHSTTHVWDFNRQHMPSPGSMPPVGTILRFPHDPHSGNVEGSGGPSLDDLKGKGVTDEDLAKATPTPGVKGAQQTDPNVKPAADAGGAPAGSSEPTAAQETAADAASKAAGGTVEGAGAGPGTGTGADADGFETA